MGIKTRVVKKKVEVEYDVVEEYFEMEIRDIEEAHYMKMCELRSRKYGSYWQGRYIDSIVVSIESWYKLLKEFHIQSFYSIRQSNDHIDFMGAKIISSQHLKNDEIKFIL